jgi:hypothetical protein
MKTATTIKLTKKTLDLLKNFSAINASFYMEPGNTLFTLNPSGTLCAEAKIDETVDTKFGIFDLPKFLGAISLFASPEFEFEDKHVTVSGQGSTVKFYYCELKLIEKIVKNYNKKIKLVDTKYTFDLTSKQIADLHRMANILELSNISFEAAETEGVNIKVFDKKNRSANVYSINRTDGKVLTDEPKSILILTEYLKDIYPGDYTVSVTDNITQWKHKTMDLKYTIANDSSK